ncbi:Putative S-methyl-5'-thioadenosine phosphorylase [Atta colombica]|uniref:S-methyl-5'-thioadenosine phosphorylase n=1 Tax=Atta colombica TaxID=520822 RepID=A0A195BSE9_9HYME|nr:PREDICTED: S-methyl-5'-thioadenosine phosphorylase isoform X2 [Atta colombica]KYM89957.1 Putative S-methyl-5'-thioadenosine phosphorylase [Atta colombica]
MTNKIKVGIICGSGLGDGLNKTFNCSSITSRENAKNDFGYPSSDLYHGCIDGVDIVLLARHGAGHVFSPTRINYRANIEALRLADCTHVLASTACGSLTESIGKGQLVVPDSFIDRTISRKGTFYDGTSTMYNGVCHMPMEPAFDPRTSEILLQAAKKLGYNIRKGGTVITIEGPRFSSKAESNALRLWGGHLVNMTICPEVILAKEAGLLYAAIAMATDYDCWKECEDNVHAADVLVVFKQNVHKITNVLLEAVKFIGCGDWEQDIFKLKNLIENSNVTVKK